MIDQRSEPDKDETFGSTKGKMKISKIICGFAAVIATLTLAPSLSAANAQPSPRAAAQQTRQVPGVAIDPEVARQTDPDLFQSPRAQASQTRVLAGSAAGDRDYTRNRSQLLSGKDPARAQHTRYLKAAGKSAAPLAPLK